MSMQLAVYLKRDLAGQPVASVTEVCADLGISRQTYYKYRRRFQAEGWDGLEPRSRRPLSSPRRTDLATVAKIIDARKLLDDEGWDNGAWSIQQRLAFDGHQPPSQRTIHRILVREGLVEPEPRKRPHSSRRRFQFPASHDCWQLDAATFHLADGQEVVVFQLTDDHSRLEVASLAWSREDTEGAWRCLEAGIASYGRPRMVLTDNSLAFSGKPHGFLVSFERNLRSLGINPITSRPLNPQTCGKNERIHRTLRRWLSRQPTPTTLADLQHLMDRWRTAYNDRPHQSLHGSTPHHAELAGRRHNPAPQHALDQPIEVSHHTVNHRGYVKLRGYTIALGARYRHLPITVFHQHGHILAFHQETLICDLQLDPTTRYQPLATRQNNNT